MATTAPATSVEVRRTGFDSGGGSRGWDGGGGGGSFRPPHPAQTYRLGMLLGLASISMMFIGLTSAYLVRQGLDPGWRTIGMPPLLVVNTVILLASSLTMERARRSVRQPLGRPAVNRWLAATLLLGLLFLAGQLAAWRQLSAKGFYLSTTAHSAFFYLLTGLHGLHLLGGLLALAYLNVRLSRRSDLGPEGAFVSIRRQRAMEATALYWHFMDGLWVYLLLLLFAFR